MLWFEILFIYKKRPISKAIIEIFLKLRILKTDRKKSDFQNLLIQMSIRLIFDMNDNHLSGINIY